MEQNLESTRILAAAITKSASKQTYYTILFLADRNLAADAYRAYGYFRWVDDILDSQTICQSISNQIEAAEKIAFVKRQRNLLEDCYRGENPIDICSEEQILVDLVRNDTGQNSGLRSYLHNMMGVMEFDIERRGRLITQVELADYSLMLATSVTDALNHFIGHDEPPPPADKRYLAVTAAHITHMLRDTQEDIENAYFNVPAEYLRAHGITQWDVTSPAYQDWVCSRVHLARQYFDAGRESLAQVKNLRRRLAGFAYMARFEWMLRAIEKDNYCLRDEYRERKGLKASLWMSWVVLTSMFAPARPGRSADF